LTVFPRSLALLLLVPALAGAATLYINGPYITGIENGYGSANTSVLDGAAGMNTFGFGAQSSAGNRVADDFVVPAGGWNITGFTWFNYQTGSTTTSTFTGATLRIWDGTPGDGGSVIWGDTTTNVLTSSTFTGVYRVLDTALTGSTRPIMQNELAAALFLAPGTYWVDVDFTGSLGSGPWAVPITILGTPITGNARQYVPSIWNNLVDGGTGAPAQGLPFIVNGSAPEVPEPSTAALCAIGTALLLLRLRRKP